jgi:hypothetical protein
MTEEPRKEMVNPSDIEGVMCGWAGCGTTAKFAEQLVPEGWRVLSACPVKELLE